MTIRHGKTRMKRLAWLSRGALVTGLLLGSPEAPAWAQAGDDGLTGRLIELLVKKGVLPREEASALLAEAKADNARNAKKPAKPAPEAGATPPPEEPVPPGTVRVTYVPQIVRDQIAQQVRADLMPTLKNGGWAEPDQPNPADERFHFFGDLRLRGQLDELPSSNAQLFPNFNAINSGSPFDITRSAGGVPLLNDAEDRSAFRLRARAGIDVRIDDGITAEVRIATGNDASPVSSNQTFGQNGPFTKYAIWLDRAFVKAQPYDWLTASAGRMPNPFWTTDLIYYDDLGFDGVAVSASPRLSKSVTGFLTVGAFPVFNTAFNFGSPGTETSYSSTDGWLFAAQAGGEWQATRQVSTKFAAGYFDYSGISGKISSPCTIVFSSDTCNTDPTRALFPGNGNTLIPIRNLISTPFTSSGVATLPQYFGLASPFHILDLHGRVDLERYKPVIVSFEAEFADNLAFDRGRAVALGFNNFGVNSNAPDVGNKAWMVRISAGKSQILERWDWNVSLAYKYLESDSVLASLNDPDFHLGGTNAKGFILGGNFGLAHNTWLTARWLSSTQVSGAPYVVDTIQADLNVRF
jgi:hypothetical protein